MVDYIKIVFIYSILSLCVALSAQNNKPKNVILLIGDGMGPVQVETLYFLRQDSMVHMRSFPCHGFSMTHSLNDSVTDSAAGGTALASGNKTNNGFISLYTDSLVYTTIMEWAKQRDMSTGIVVSCGITHATPASFYAHVSDRDQYENIAFQLMDADLDFVAGGYRNHFLPNKRKDGLSLIDSLKKRKYDVVDNLDELQESKSDRIVALLSPKHPKKANKRNDLLAVSTGKALEVLSKNKNGFVLMIEGSQIDWACHVNNFRYFKQEILDFDDVVKIAYDFAAANGETLVIVTADHECGAMKLSDDIYQMKRMKNRKHINRFVSFHSLNHTGVNVPVFAFGPGAELFQGIMDNTEIYKKIVCLLSRE